MRSKARAMAGQTSEELEELKRDRDEMKEQLKQMMEMLNKLTGPLDTTPKEGATNQKADDSGGKVDIGSNSKNNGKAPADFVDNTQLGYVYTHTAPYYAHPRTSGVGTYVPYPPIENPVHYDPRTFMVQQGMPTGITEKKDDPVEENKRKLSLLEEMLCGLEGSNSYYRLVDTSELSLVEGLVIPPKFKTPEFEKFDGTKDFPNNHLRSYIRKMGPYASNEKLMIHYFQDSLAGTASIWYNQLDRHHIRSRDDLAKAFLDQYKYLVELAPTRETLKVMERKPTESYTEFAQRWRNKAAQVRPSIEETEISGLFIDTQKSIFYEKLFNMSGEPFAKIVVMGQKLDNSIKSGRIFVVDEAKKGHVGKKKEEVSNVNEEPYKPYYPPPAYNYPQYGKNSVNYYRLPTPVQPSYHAYGYYAPPHVYPYLYQHSGDINAVGGAPFRPRPSNPIPGSSQPSQQKAPAYSSGSAYVNPMKPPLPTWYDVKAHCDYHSGSEGHSTENCRRLKYAVQDLVRSGKLSFGSVAQVNPLPDHGKVQANMVGTGEIVKQKISEITTSLDIVFRALAKVGMVEKGDFGDGELAEVCPYHGGIHGICESPEFKGKVQKLMDEHQIEFCVEG
ncbi:Retrotransposon gag protein [Corchorus capsularis]|uniref:Retrotransposon gag protein n=1 Tax=Corchorus capsularis TaxID=210143 RepID=A0A1R3G5E1_COCAP|nr:Retrotransposon gag protein [Corchorus capsularis]